tara:strand:+ start:468 stop:1529 length:1062 start_codon:yes stop_codon:yes gene_type:complete
MSSYNPFARGSTPVGTRQYRWTDTVRDHTLPVDVWYPAAEAHRGQDLNPATMNTFETVSGLGETRQQAVLGAETAPGVFPLIVFSHGFGGERRQSTFFCTHLASHGYVVASMDHVGNTIADMISGESAAGDQKVLERFMVSRPQDASFVIDQMLAGAAEVSINSDQIGMSGHSFGGWTTLKTIETDARIGAAVLLAPGGGASGDDMTAAMATSLSFNWGRVVPTLYLVAELDSILPLDGMRDLRKRNPAPSTTVVLQNADHFHFNDNIEQAHDGFKAMMSMMAADTPELTAMLSNMKPSSELAPGSHAYDLINGLGLARFDATLRKRETASVLMAEDLVQLMAARDIAVELLP